MQDRKMEPQPIGAYFRAYPDWNRDRAITTVDSQGRAIVAFFKDATGQYQAKERSAF